MTGPMMWPRTLPQEVRDDPLRRAEVTVFDLLQSKLSAGWHVFYSRPWLGLTPSGAERDGECDFVVVHPDKGVLAIEVKGGGISFDAETGIWRSHDRDDREWVISDPVKQAMKSKHALLGKAKAQRSWPSAWIRFRHGVIFPNPVSPPSDLGADRPRSLFCCRPDLDTIHDWVERRLAGEDDEQGPGVAGLNALRNVLARSFMLHVPLGHVLRDSDDAIRLLTPQQFQVLDYIADVQRAAAGGGAGTGKTVIACEDAVRHAEAGRRTLLTCRGAPLADDLRSRLAGKGVDVLTFGELSVSRLCGNGPAEDAADRLLLAVERDAAFRYDAIIVDEAQDFRAHWWVALDSLLHDPQESFLHAFYDTNQQLYGQISSQLRSLNLTPIRLTRNLRNTQTIHRTASRHYQGPGITADGPAGVSIERVSVAGGDLFRKAQQIVNRLVSTDSVRPEDIVVLTPDGTAAGRQLAGLPRSVACSSILDFKGLERAVVVLIATREIADDSEMAYVALSRARTHLVVISEPVILDWLAP